LNNNWKSNQINNQNNNWPSNGNFGQNNNWNWNNNSKIQSPPESIQVDSPYENRPNNNYNRQSNNFRRVYNNNRQYHNHFSPRHNFNRYPAQKTEPQTPLKRQATGTVSQLPQKEMRMNNIDEDHFLVQNRTGECLI